MANPITPAAASNDPNAVHASTAATGPAARIATQSTPPSKLATTSGATGTTSLPKDTVQISTAAQKALEEAQQTQAQAAKQASQQETQAQSPKSAETKPQ